MSQNTSMFGYISDTDESLKAKEGGSKFGLNTGMNLVKLAFNSKCGKGGTDGEGVDITVKKGEKESWARMFSPVGSYIKKGKDTYNPGDEGYEELLISKMQEIGGVLTHYVKAVGVTEAQLQNAFATPPANFEAFVNTYVSLLPQNFQQIPLDIFFEYQYTLKEGSSMTYPTLPSNMKGGYFIVPTQKPVGEWKETVNTEGELTYVDDQNNEHPFTRTKAFMEGNKGTQQKKGEGNATTEAKPWEKPANTPTPPAPNTAPNTTSWGKPQ